MPFFGNNTSWRSRAAILVAGLVLAAPVNALTFTVDSTIDAIDSSLGDGSCDDGSGKCTLRAAIQEANNLGGSHIIELQPGTYSLSLSGSGEDLAASGDLDINADITIRPVSVADARSVVISGAGIDRVFHILSGSTIITGVTIRQGNILSAHGGAIRNSATLTLNDCTLTANAAGPNDGGAIYNDGTLTLERCTVNANSAGRGGAIFNNIGSVAVTNSTISGNSATDLGGGLYNVAGANIALTHVTLNGNTAGTDGGGIYNLGTTTATGSIVNANTVNNCSTNITSNNYNIDSEDTCGFNQANDQTITDPQLGGLADNGGPTNTHALPSGSPAIDTADPTCPLPATDQRGVPRPVDGGSGAICDIGAYEWTAAVSLSIINRHNDDCPDLGDPVTYTLTANNVGTVGATGVKIIDTLPTEMTFVSASPGCTRYERTVLCDMGSFGAGTIRTFTITLTVDAIAEQAAIKANSAAIYSIENDADIDDNTSNEYTTVDCSDCFIATAAFGGGSALETRYLRAFRDSYLKTNAIGRKFVELYYSYSPPVADALRRHDGLRAAVRVGLMPLVALSKTLAGADKEKNSGRI